MEQDEVYTMERGRTYVHDKCGAGTRVSGTDFRDICDPFHYCSGTYCVGCQRLFPLRAFVWENSGESLTAYRSRLRKEVPMSKKVWFLIMPLLCGLIGGLIGYFVVKGNDPFEAIGIGAVAGLAIGYFVACWLVPVLGGITFYERQ